MKNEILKLKPKSIFDVVDESFYFEKNIRVHEEYIKGGNYYEVYYAISKHFQPSSILEIGVRFGYSLYPMIKASDSLKFARGYDIDEYEKDSVNIAHKAIESRIDSDIDFEIQIQDSQQLTELDRSYDLIHIDGNHTYEGKVHDLRLTLGKSKVVVVDDYNFLPHVKQAVDFFVKENQDKIEKTDLIESFRGTFLIVYK